MEIAAFIEAWKVTCERNNWKFDVALSNDDIHVHCPFCERRSKNQTPDNNRSLTVNPTKEKTGKPTGCFHCYRCANPSTKGWGMHRLLGGRMEQFEPVGPKKVRSLDDIKARKRNFVAEIGDVITPVVNLPTEHIARQILKRDKFTDEKIELIAREFALLYCAQGRAVGSGNNSTHHRLVIPIFQLKQTEDGRSEYSLIGWQARWLPPANRPDLLIQANESRYLSENRMTKYILNPGFDRNNLYNYDRVVKQRLKDRGRGLRTLVVLLEGAKKAWKLPNHATAQFGTGSLDQESKTWAAKLAIFDDICICYDKDKYDQAVRNVEKIREMIDTDKQRCIAVRLPSMGPGDFDKYPTEVIEHLIKSQLHQYKPL